MSVRKRKNKDGSFCWEFCFTIQKIPRKQYRRSGFRTKTEAQNAEQKALAKYLDGNNLLSQNTIFYELGKKYLDRCKTKAKSTQVNYTTAFKKHLNYFYNFKLIDINSLMVEDWIDKSDKSPNTINEALKFAKAVFNYGIKHRIINYNPFLYIDKKIIARKERKRLTLEEATALLIKCKDKYPDFYPILATQILTGVREGELLALKWSDIDFKRGVIKIQRQYTQGELKETLKTSSSYRDIDMCPTLAKILKEHRLKNKKFSEFIFTNSKGNLHNPRNIIQRRFEPLMFELYGNKKYMRFYDLRGTYVDILLSQGVPLKYIQAQVGHATYLTTMNEYSKLIKDVNDKAINILENSVSIL